VRFAPRHGRFLTAFALGLGAGIAAWLLSVAPVFALLVAVDAFFLIYLLLTARILGSTSARDLRRHAEEDDEGVALILALALVAVVVSITAIFLVVNADAQTPGPPVLPRWQACRWAGPRSMSWPGSTMRICITGGPSRASVSPARPIPMSGISFMQASPSA
jgi:hypothetical protein